METRAKFDVFARFYDLDYGDFLEDLPLYLGFAERSGSPILELGCGTGRLLLSLAEAGYNVTGIDSSSAMLAIAAGKLGKQSKRRVKLVQANMTDFQLDRQFNLIIIPTNGLMLVTSLEGQAEILDRVRQHLADDGLLVIDLFNPNIPEMMETDKQLIHAWTKPGGGGTTVAKFVTQTPDLANQIQEISFFYDEINPKSEMKRTVAPFTQRYLFRFEAELLLERCGLELENVYGSYDLEDYESGSEKMILVARRA